MKNEHQAAAGSPLFEKIADIIEQARRAVAQAANLAMVHSYFEIGRMIVEDEQQGKSRAAYGKHTLRDLSERLAERFGKGFSPDNLDRMRNFYLTYNQKISATPLRKFVLSWSHYLLLMRIQNPNERSFYEIEAAENQWSLATLRRQYDSSLYERLALSRDKEAIKKLSERGQVVEQLKNWSQIPHTNNGKIGGCLIRLIKLIKGL